MIAERDSIKLMTKALILAAALIAATAGSGMAGPVIHCLNVGQGDCTVIVSPTGGTFLFDAGNNGIGSSVVVPYLSSLGLSALDYVCASHYHSDHIGGIDEVVSAIGIDSVRVAVLDRGWYYTTPSYYSYEAAVTPKRTTIYDGQVIDLGGGLTITCVAVNGNGVVSSPFDQYDENCMSIALHVQYLDFDFFVAGDLSGVNSSSYHDIETSVAPEVGPVEVYRVDHHGSISNSNNNLVSALRPEVSVISVGDSNPYGHPMQTILNRLAFYGSYIYQTEAGSGGTIPAGAGEVVDGHVVIEVDSTYYVINYTDFYDMGASPTAISEVNEDDANGSPVLFGQPVVVEGIVTVATGTFSATDTEIFIQDATGGVCVFDRNNPTPAVAVGDRLRVSGIVDQSTGLTRLTSPIITIEVTGLGEPAPVVVTTAEIDSAGEAYEGLFVKVEACSITGGTWPDEYFDGTLTIDDGTGDCTLFIDSDTDIDGSEEPTGLIEIVGIVTQYDTSFPYHSGYRLVPRSTADISLPYSGVASVSDLPLLIKMLPNPARGSLKLVFGQRAAGVPKDLRFYDIAGRKVAEAHCGPGEETFEWDTRDLGGRKLAGGIYFAELIAGRRRVTAKIVLLD